MNPKMTLRGKEVSGEVIEQKNDGSVRAMSYVYGVKGKIVRGSVRAGHLIRKPRVR